MHTFCSIVVFFNKKTISMDTLHTFCWSEQNCVQCSFQFIRWYQSFKRWRLCSAVRLFQDPSFMIKRGIWYSFNLLTPRSVQHVTSPLNFHIFSSKQVTRRLTHQIQLILIWRGNMSQLERKIDSQNLGVKGLNPALNDLNHHASFSTKNSLQERVFL